MGGGSFLREDYKSYSESRGAFYDDKTGRVSGQEFRARRIDESLDPSKFEFRECANSEEHPNTIPVILALDVTGSMGRACEETAAALGVIMEGLYKKVKDVEFCIMGIGDLAYDDAPIQMSQFESDVRIAESLDKVYMEKGGGGNGFESYTAAWYMGLHRTKLDCYDKQGRKGIIITMGDEPLNPYLPVRGLNRVVNSHEEADVETKELYEEVTKKFDVYHIAVDDRYSCFNRYRERVLSSFREILGENFKVSTIKSLASTIELCILQSIKENENRNTQTNVVNENGEISW